MLFDTILEPCYTINTMTQTKRQLLSSLFKHSVKHLTDAEVETELFQYYEIPEYD